MFMLGIVGERIFPFWFFSGAIRSLVKIQVLCWLPYYMVVRGRILGVSNTVVTEHLATAIYNPVRNRYNSNLLVLFCSLAA